MVVVQVTQYLSQTAVFAALLVFAGAFFTLLWTVFNATVLEPRRHRKAEKAKTIAIRRALYNEIMSLYLTLIHDDTKFEVVTNPTEMLKTPFYNKMLEEPALMYRLTEAPAIQSIYKRISILRQKLSTTSGSQNEIQKTIQAIQRAIVRSSTIKPMLIADSCYYASGMEELKSVSDTLAAAVLDEFEQSM